MITTGEGTITVLYVDSSGEATARADRLGRTRDHLEVTAKTDPTAALECLEAGLSVDCIVSDHGVAGPDGLSFLRAVRERDRVLPFVLFTGDGSETLASEAISAGVTDYLSKDVVSDQYDALANCIERAVESRQARARADSDAKFSRLVENLPGIVYRAGNERGWPMESIAGGCRELTGYDPDDIVEGTVSWGWDVLHEDDRQRTWEGVQAAVENGEPFEVTYRLVTADGDLRWMWERGHGVYERGELVALDGFITDVTDRKQRERDLERYETIIQTVGDPVYALDGEGRITFVNDALEEMTGYGTTELVGEHARRLTRGVDARRGREHIRGLLSGGDGSTVKYEVELVTKSGDHIPCELQLALLQADGRFNGTVGIVRDISERKRREERLEGFAGTVAHDLRGPLDAMTGWAELARETGDEAYFDNLEDAAQRMDQLIEDLLTLAQQGRTVGDTEAASLAALASRAWEDTETGAATLDLAVDGSVRCDPFRFQQVFENLFRNAVEHGAGPVQVRVGTLGRENGFFVSDDGPGIPPAERGRVFEHGYTTHDDGTGFGLSIVERIVEAHGWEIVVTESERGGARFEILTG